jgi:threonine/homoserine/homoserine lactone efflux protein
MPDLSNWLAYALISLGMVLTPGPNMIYLISRSICQGRTAGYVSLGGVALGFLVYSFGGALYLAYMAWQAIRPGGRSPFQVRDLPKDTPRKLFTMGLVTNLLNPKVAVMYLSLLPQFIDPNGHGSVLAQSLVLGFTQILISVSVNAVIATMAGSIAVFFVTRPGWQVVQRWLMGSVLMGLAVRMAVEGRR